MSYVTDWQQADRESIVCADIIMAKTISKVLDSSVAWTRIGVTNTYRISCSIVVQYVRQKIYALLQDGRPYQHCPGGPSEVDAWDCATTHKGAFYHDEANEVLYVNPRWDGGTKIDLDKSVIVGLFKVPRSTKAVSLDGKHYIPHLLADSGAFQTRMECQDDFGGFVSPSGAGSLMLMNAADPYYSYNDELRQYRWLGVNLYNGINTYWHEADWVDYQQMRSLDILRVTSKDRVKLDVELAARIRKAKVKVGQLLYDPEDLDSDEEDYHGQEKYQRLYKAIEGHMQPVQIGQDDATGTDEDKFETATKCECTDYGTPTRGKLTYWKLAGYYKDYETDEKHGDLIATDGIYVRYSDGNIVQYDTSGGGAQVSIAANGTEFHFTDNAIEINPEVDEVRATVTGMTDVAGKFTGAGSSIVQKWHDAAQLLAVVIGGYRTEEINVESFTALGSAKTIDGTTYNGTVDTTVAWYGNCRYIVQDKNDLLAEHLDVLAKSGRVIITESNDGLLIAIPLIATRSITDVSINGDLMLGWEEVLQDERVYSRICVEYSMKGGAGSPRQCYSKKHQDVDATTNVRNNFAKAWYGRREDKILKTALKQKTHAKAIANAWRDTYRTGAVKIGFTDITGACMTLLPGNRIVVRKTRDGGDWNEKVFWVWSAERNYIAGTVKIGAIEAI